MATVTERRNKNGVITSYTIRVFMYQDGNGKNHYETTSFKVKPEWKESSSRKKAEAFAATFERDIKTGAVSNENRTFDSYAEYVISLKEKTGICKIGTIDTYNYYREKLSPIIGHIKLKDLRPEHLNRLYMNFADGTITGRKLAPKTIQGYHGFISSVLEQAYKEGRVVNNVARRSDPPKVEKKPPESLEVDEVDKLFEDLKKEPIRWRTAVMLLIYTGLRRGELCGLKWDAINLADGSLSIRNNLLHRRKGFTLYEDTPKTPESTRVVMIPPDMIELLKEYKAWQDSEKERLGEYYQDGGWVFVSDNGKPMRPNSVTNYCGKLTKKYGKHIWSHLFRHTQASLLLANKTPVTSVSKRLGHSQVSTTLNIYAHALKNADEESIRVLEDLFHPQK